jgi:hypothetical protein
MYVRGKTGRSWTDPTSPASSLFPRRSERLVARSIENSQSREIAWLCQEPMRDGHGSQRFFYFGAIGEYEPHDTGKSVAHRLQECGAVHFGHSQIGDDYIKGSRLKNGERCCSVGCEAELPTVFLSRERALEILEDRRFIVHEQNFFSQVLL